MMRWSADRLDQLERAVRDGLRVALTTRRGTEYIVVAARLATDGSREALVARLPMTGEELRFTLDDITAFQVLGPAG
jgi:transcriptional antiterminator Rof (Rho-off)